MVPAQGLIPILCCGPWVSSARAVPPGPPVSPLTVGLEGFAAGDVSQGLQLLLQQALGQQVPHKVPQYGPAIRRGVNPGDLGSGQDGAAG